MIKKPLILLTAITLLLTGCATQHTGSFRANDPQITQQLVEEKADKKQVYIFLGQPHDVIYENSSSMSGESQWVYYSLNIRNSAATYVPFVGLFAGGAVTTGLKQTIFFNQKGIVYKSDKKLYEGQYKNIWSGLAEADLSESLDPKAERVQAELRKLKIPFDYKVALTMKQIESLAD